MIRWRIGWLVVAVAVALGLASYAAPEPAGKDRPAKPETLPSGRQEGKKEAWQSELPPGWDQLNEEQKQHWTGGLKRAKKAVTEHARRRENAALRAMEMAARKGVPVSDAENMAKTGLDEGLPPQDFEPLGKSVSAWTKQGLRGKDLAAAIHQEVRRRQEERRRMREQKRETKRQERPKGKPDDAGKGKGKSPDAGEAQEQDAGRGAPQGKGRGKGKGKK